MFEPEEILNHFDIPIDDVLCIYPYGSRIYGCVTETSDHDWVIVYRSSLLPNGAFRNNAISSEDRSHQAICYSRTGFINAINTYDMTALECMFIPEEVIPLKKMNFSIKKWEKKAMVNAIISKMSSSWYIAIKNKKKDVLKCKKNVYHSLRMLRFALQMLDKEKIYDYSECNELKKEIFNTPDENFRMYKYLDRRDIWINLLKTRLS